MCVQNKNAWGIAFAISILALLVSGCAPSSYLVRNPVPSAQKFESVAAQDKADLTLIDQRPSSERNFHAGVLRARLNTGDGAINAPEFLARHLQAELISRGVPAQVAQGSGGAAKLNLNTFRVENYRATMYSPFVTFTYLSVDLERDGKLERIAAYVKRGKTPVWSFDEVVEPTFSQPLSVAVQELASKLAARLFNSRVSDGAVDALIAKLQGRRSEESFLDVYALGFSNNSRAIPALVTLTNDQDEYVRLAAISSLGTIRAVAQFGLLKSLYSSGGGLWQDRGMALKAIGDLGTDEANEFLKQEEASWSAQPVSKESSWNLQIIRLYTRKPGAAKSIVEQKATVVGAAPLLSAVDVRQSAKVRPVVAASGVPERLNKNVKIISPGNVLPQDVKVNVANSSAGVAPPAVKVEEQAWRYGYKDLYGKARTVRVFSRPGAQNSMVEEWSVDGGSEEFIRWVALDPLIRSRTVSGMEWITFSPFLFENDALLQGALRKVSLFGEDFSSVIRPLGQDSILVGGERIAVSKFEIVGKSLIGGSSSISMYASNPIGSFTLVVWYAKELKRVVKHSFTSQRAFGGTLRDRYEMVLLGRS